MHFHFSTDLVLCVQPTRTHSLLPVQRTYVPPHDYHYASPAAGTAASPSLRNPPYPPDVPRVLVHATPDAEPHLEPPLKLRLPPPVAKATKGVLHPPLEPQHLRSGGFGGGGGGGGEGWVGLWGQGTAPDKAAKGMLHPPLKPQHLGVGGWVVWWK